MDCYQISRFIKDRRMRDMSEELEDVRNFLKELKNKDWNTIASIYNGSGYLELAKKLGREPYNITMAKNHKKLKPMFE